MSDLDRRRAALVTALAATHLDTPPGFGHTGVEAVKTWLNNWSGLGIVIVGMARQGYDLELRQFRHGWSAAFYPTGIAHSIVYGSGWDATAGVAVQKAALETLMRRDPTESPSVEEESPE
jgi:hypothetical protein